MKHNSFMDSEDTFDDDVDFLWPNRRRRLPSETCMSSHLPTLRSSGPTSQQQCCETTSFPMYEATLCDELQQSFEEFAPMKDIFLPVQA
jgi:hypothetical protein